jgi:hypothetical protein
LEQVILALLRQPKAGAFDLPVWRGAGGQGPQGWRPLMDDVRGHGATGAAVLADPIPAA